MKNSIGTPMTVHRRKPAKRGKKDKPAVRYDSRTLDQFSRDLERRNEKKFGNSE